MLDRITDMRVEAATLRGESRQLRLEETRALRKARKLLSQDRLTNDNTGPRVGLAYLRHQNIYVERMAVRRESRLHHLARMLLKEKDYFVVGATTYHRVNAQELFDRVWQWDPSISFEYVCIWLGQTTADYEETV